jgi:HK97 gp10 family phage protein
MKMSYGFEGFEEMGKRLHALPDRMNKRVVGGAARKAAKVIQEEAIARAPADENSPFSKGHETYGSLKENITVVRARGTANRANFFISTGNAFWSFWAEHGRLGKPGTPFLRPALDEKHEEALDVMAAELDAGLTRETKKLNSDYRTARKALLGKRERIG